MSILNEFRSATEEVFKSLKLAWPVTKKTEFHMMSSLKMTPFDASSSFSISVFSHIPKMSVWGGGGGGGKDELILWIRQI